jgi:hypothetical protein
LVAVALQDFQALMELIQHFLAVELQPLTQQVEGVQVPAAVVQTVVQAAAADTLAAVLLVEVLV